MCKFCRKPTHFIGSRLICASFNGLDGLASLLFGLPPLQERQELDLGIFGSLGFFYNILDREATIALSMLQDFSLTSTLPAVLKLEDNTTINFNVGDEISLLMPENVGESLNVEAFIDFNALFSNTTRLGIDLSLDFLSEELGWELPIIGNQNLSPLFEESVWIYDTTFNLFDETFQLGGFNQERVSFQVGTLPAPWNNQPQIRLLSRSLAQPVQNNFFSCNIRAKNTELPKEVRMSEPSSTVALFSLGMRAGALMLKEKNFS